MARKTSDIALLLGSRGRSRSRGGFGHQLVGFIDGLLGRTLKGRRRDDRRSNTVSMWALLGAVLIAFGGGFLLGGQVAGAAQKDREALNANVAANDGSLTDGSLTDGRTPAFVGELDTQPLADFAFVVAAYPNLAAADARQRAADLAGWLRDQGLAKARAYPFPRGDSTLWVVNVYYGGEAEQREAQAALLALPANAPDQAFVQFRQEPDWPIARQIR